MTESTPPREGAEVWLSVSFGEGEYQLVDSLYTPIQECIVPVVAWVEEQIHWRPRHQWHEARE